jgi:hypothetical protein
LAWAKLRRDERPELSYRGGKIVLVSYRAINQTMCSLYYHHLILSPDHRRRLPVEAVDARPQELVTQEVVGRYAMHHWTAL